MARRAFTLIELLVVVAVLGMLMAILVPALGSAKARAKRVTCAVNLRSLAGADVMYSYDYNGYVSRNSGIGLAPSVFHLLARNQQITLASSRWPVGDGSGFESEYAMAYTRIKWLQCPSFPVSPWPVSYVVNAFDPSDVGNEISWVRLGDIRRPSEVCSFTEANAKMPVDNFEFYDVWHKNHLAVNTWKKVTWGKNGGGRICSDDRHRGQINMAYYDQHVEDKAYKKKDGKSNITVEDFVGE